MVYTQPPSDGSALSPGRDRETCTTSVPCRRPCCAPARGADVLPGVRRRWRDESRYRATRCTRGRGRTGRPTNPPAATPDSRRSGPPRSRDDPRLAGWTAPAYSPRGRPTGGQMAIGLASPNSRPGNRASSTAATSSRKHRNRRIGVDDDHGMRIPAAPRRPARLPGSGGVGVLRHGPQSPPLVRATTAIAAFVCRAASTARAALSPSVRCGACTPRRISSGRPSGGSSAAGDAPCGAAAGPEPASVRLYEGAPAMQGAGATHRGGTDVGAAGLGAGPVEPGRPGGSRAHGRGSALAHRRRPGGRKVGEASAILGLIASAQGR